MRFLFLIIVQLIYFFALAQKNTPIDYINLYAKKAQIEMQRSGVPAAITLAQGILESESGNSELALKSNNHFGIKCKTEWQGEKVYHNDDARGECFRKYETVEQSYVDHSDFLKKNPRYASLFLLDVTDYKGWAKGLKKAGYATNPIYAQQLIDVIEKYALQQYNDLSNTMALANNDELLLKEENRNVTAKERVTTASETPINSWGKEFNTIMYINQTKAVLLNAGTSLLATAEKYNISLDKILDFNDWKKNREDILKEETIVFLQRKRKQGAVDIHVVKEGETLHDIAQAEGIRLEILLRNNNITENQLPTVGEKLYLNTKISVTSKLNLKK
jgi:LysM repeat protein